MRPPAVHGVGSETTPAGSIATDCTYDVLFNALLNNADFQKLDFSTLQMTLGGGMAGNLLKASFSLTVYNRTAAKAKALLEAGARLASTPAEAVKGASIVIGMLADDNASREVWAGRNGALEVVTGRHPD